MRKEKEEGWGLIIFLERKGMVGGREKEEGREMGVNYFDNFKFFFFFFFFFFSFFVDSLDCFALEQLSGLLVVFGLFASHKQNKNLSKTTKKKN